MRNDIPPDVRKNLELLPPELRGVVEKAIDATYPTPEEEARERLERQRARRREDALLMRTWADQARRALEAEWGDDIRRAADELTREVRAGVAVLADWADRAKHGKPPTRIEWLAVRKALDTTAVRYALAAVAKLVEPAERERRAGTQQQQPRRKS